MLHFGAGSFLFPFFFDGVADHIGVNRQTEEQSPDVKELPRYRENYQHQHRVDFQLIPVNTRVKHIGLDHVYDPNQDYGY